MPNKNTAKSTNKRSGKTSKKTKVPTSSQVKVIKLRCPNCGEIEEKVILCDHCDSPMEVIDAVDKSRSEVENDVTIDTVDEDGSATGSNDNPSEEDVLSEGLTDIFSDDESSDNMDVTDDAGGDSLSDIVDMLDQEE